jgi:hypothetical protein
MSVTLTVVQRIAADVAREQDRRLEVVGAVPAQGEIGYAEVILTIRGCQVEPCTVMIGVSRNATESEIRDTVTDRLRQHLHEHRPARSNSD